VTDVVQRAQDLFSLYDRELGDLVPAGAEIFDAHVHVGRDIDGFVAPLADLTAFLMRYGASGAFAFCLDEPDRHPAFRAANDRTLAAAAASGGLLAPFVRLDLAESPVEEATRCLDLGARGIKLHPRSQRFRLDDGRLRPVFELAAERRVPILIHGGRGLPPIARHLHDLVDANPGTTLIVAHGGIADLAALSEAFAGHPGVFFDTSMWSGVDLLDVFSRIPPEQVLYASDYPYGTQPSALMLCLRTARVAGLSEEHARDLLGRQARRIVLGEQPTTPTRALGPAAIRQPLSLVRIHNYLTMATPLLWTRQTDTIGVLGLALNACAERDGHEDVRERIAELLACAGDLWRALAEIEDEEERTRQNRVTFRLVHLADILAVTTVD
jgi:predicted TIM-barrel fold metal-dependent hydrolase